MFSSSLGLENVRLVDSTRSIALDLASKLELAYSRPPFSNESNESEFIREYLTGGNVWSCIGSRCRLEINILINHGVPAIEEQACLAEHVGNILRSAEIWTELSLQTTLEMASHKETPGKGCGFVIYLSHTNSENSVPLLESANDARIPTMVDCIQVVSVQLVLDFDIRLKPPNKKVKRVDSVELMFSEDNTQSKLSQEPISSTQGSMASMTCFTSSITSSQAPSMMEVIFDEEDMLFNDVLNSQYSQAEVKISDSQGPPAFSAKRLATIEDAAPYSYMTETNLTTIGNLAEAALLILIGMKGRSYTNAKVLSRLPSFPLSRLAPSIWSPGYLQAMSERANYITEISQDLDNSILKHCQSPALRKKLLQLVDEGKPRIEKSHSKQQKTSKGQGTCWKMWKISQRLLYDPSVMRRKTLLRKYTEGAQTRNLVSKTRSNFEDDLFEIDSICKETGRGSSDCDFDEELERILDGVTEDEFEDLLAEEDEDMSAIGPTLDHPRGLQMFFETDEEEMLDI